MKIETMLRALTMAQLAWHHPGDYRMRTRLDWFEMVQRIFAGITRRYNALQAEVNRLRHYCKAEFLTEFDALKAENARLVELADQVDDLLKVMPSPDDVARLQQENARLRDSVEFWKAEALKDGNDE